ncbi:hypothetical protein EOM86_11395, partial [Candidatus Nomurabacteria bacterium]|nr:hypothetical protein [Candidatus Nomurabacteria bacterium]
NLLDNDIEMFAHEIWNEPDFDIFFTGSFDDYIDVYRYGSRGVYDADPDAVIGGLSSAYPDRRIQNGDLDKFLATVIDEDLPLDFVSYHAYNSNNVSPVSFVQQVRNALEKYSELKTVRMHLNEYNIGLSERVNSSYEAPAKTFEHLLALNSFTDLEVINWAMFLDATNVMSLVDTSGNRMPQYHALEFYNNMPYRRVAADNFTHVQAFASCDSSNASAVIYNNTPTDETISISLGNVPFEKGNIKIFVIDEKHTNFKETGNDDLELAFFAENVQVRDSFFTIKSSGFSTYLVKIDDGTGLSSLKKVEPLGKFIRRDYYYDDRSNNCYAEFDRLSQTAYVGMGAQAQAKAATSVVYDNVDTNIEVFSEYSTSTGNGVCGFQISYHTPQGYTKSEFYRVTGSGDLPSFRWGGITEVEKNAGESVLLDIKKNQPDGFDGRIRVSFYAENMPVYSYGTINIRRVGK